MRASRWLLVLAAVLAVSGVVALVMGGEGSGRGSVSEMPGPTPGAPTSRPAEPAETRSVPSSPVGGDVPIAVRSGFEQTEAGARLAAVAFLEVTEEAVVLSPAEAADLQRAMATAGFGEEFAADAEQRMTELVQAVPGGIRLRVAPIEARSIADGEDWLVSIWYVQAITIASESVVDDWRTASYRMRWEDGTWKIASFESRRGPMPGRGTQPPSETPTRFEALLSGYSDDGLN